MASSREIDEMNERLHDAYVYDILKLTLSQVIMKNNFKSLRNIPMDYLTQQLLTFGSRLGSEIKAVADADHCTEPNVNHVFRAFKNMNLTWEDFDRFMNDNLGKRRCPFENNDSGSEDAYAPAPLEQDDAMFLQQDEDGPLDDGKGYSRADAQDTTSSSSSSSSSQSEAPLKRRLDASPAEKASRPRMETPDESQDGSELLLPVRSEPVETEVQEEPRQSTSGQPRRQPGGVRIRRPMGRPMGQPMGQRTVQSTEQTTEQAVGVTITHPMGQPMGQQMGQPFAMQVQVLVRTETRVEGEMIYISDDEN